MEVLRVVIALHPFYRRVFQEDFDYREAFKGFFQFN